jgi:hypothetical protein
MGRQQALDIGKTGNSVSTQARYDSIHVREIFFDVVSQSNRGVLKVGISAVKVL